MTFTLAGGCFWCLDAVYRRIKGVELSICGYSGGSTSDPTYQQVSTGTTGHAEVVRVTFDENVVPSSVILGIFFTLHDPTTLNRQGPDVGTQYRSAMFYENEEQNILFQIERDQARALWNDPVVTEILPLVTFFEAEENHQDYFSKNPTSGYCTVVIEPKIVKARQKFEKYLLTEADS